jgi:prepilin peptidase CpaA
MNAAHYILLVVVGLAAVIDVRTRRIPNVLTLGSALAAIAFHIIVAGTHGVALALSGWAVGVALFLPFFLLRGMGAGDVKLLGAVGAWLGPAEVPQAAVLSILAGGIFGVVVACQHRYLKQALVNVWSAIGWWRIAGLAPLDGMTLEDAAGPRLAYGTAIAAGTFAAVWLMPRS